MKVYAPCMINTILAIFASEPMFFQNIMLLLGFLDKCLTCIHLKNVRPVEDKTYFSPLGLRLINVANTYLFQEVRCID